MKLTVKMMDRERYTLNGKYSLRGIVGWCLLGAMIASCLAIAFLPEEWRLLQNVAALVQAFATGIVVAQWLPIWEAVEPDVGHYADRIPPAMD